MPVAEATARRDVEVDGACVAVWEPGLADGEPVVLLHGYPSNLHLAFDYDTEVSAALKELVER
jgi:pimeloyl-ACP methyl ester carboxylesterase